MKNSHAQDVMTCVTRRLKGRERLAVSCSRGKQRVLPRALNALI